MSTVSLTSEALVDAMWSPRGNRARVVHALVVPSLVIQTRLQVQDVFIAPGQSGAHLVGLVGCSVPVLWGAVRRVALAGKKASQESV